VFTQQKADLLHEKIQESVPCIPSSVIDLIPPYLLKEQWSSEEKEETYPAPLFHRDKNSEELYKKLEDKKITLSLEDQGKAIAEYMATKNKNAGKELFSIILDKINSPTVVFDHSNYESDSYLYFMPL